MPLITHLKEGVFRFALRDLWINEDGDIFRVMYVTKFAGKIYVLHSFQKKDQKTSPKDIHIAKIRYNAITREELS